MEREQAAASPQDDRETLRQRGLRYAYFIIAWDVIEGIVAVTAGLIANSIALLGFGIDSAIEVFAASVTVWQLRGGAQARQRTALRLIAGTFLALAAYVAYESISDLLAQEQADPSIVKAHTPPTPPARFLTLHEKLPRSQAVT